MTYANKYLHAVTAIALSAFCVVGFAEAKVRSGRWIRASKQRVESREHIHRTDSSGNLENLDSLPYLQGYYPAPEVKNVTRYIPGKSWDGINCVVSAHESEALLMNMSGKVLHRWYYLSERPENEKGKKQPNWRRVHFFRNGDILAILSHWKLIKLNRDSDLLWSFKYKVHHDLDVDDKGRIFVISRKKTVVRRIYPNNEAGEDFITMLSSEGEMIKEYSLLKALENSEYKEFLKDPMPKGDIFHTNAVTVLDGMHAERSPVFKKGNLLFSMRHLNLIGILDPGQEKVVWALSGRVNGKWHYQHEPVLLENGRMMLFDNGADIGYSKILEFDPLNEKVFWQFKAKEKFRFYSRSCGTNYRLPNGNTLIVESDYGRAFEVNSGGEIVWEYVSPYRAGKKSRLIATLYDMQRVPEGYFAWLEDKMADGDTQ